MKAERIGRALGIGLRVAGRVAGQQLNAAMEPPKVPAAAPARPPAATAARPQGVQVERARAAGQATRNAARGMGGFLKPFRRVGGILWLEITGAFFLIFAMVFATFLWKQRAAWAAGQDHPRLIAEAAVALLFLYLGASAFFRAGRR